MAASIAEAGGVGCNLRAGPPQAFFAVGTPPLVVFPQSRSTRLRRPPRRRQQLRSHGCRPEGHRHAARPFRQRDHRALHPRRSERDRGPGRGPMAAAGRRGGRKVSGDGVVLDARISRVVPRNRPGERTTAARALNRKCHGRGHPEVRITALSHSSWTANIALKPDVASGNRKSWKLGSVTSWWISSW